MADPEDLVSDETAAAEEKDAAAAPDPGPMPTPEEEQAAKQNVPAPDSVKDAYKDQMKRGANVQGEGQIP
jgi:hypothetical protein